MKIDPRVLDFWQAHELLVSTILPRPIAWISTISSAGVFNIAPFSCCIPVSIKPPLLGIGISRRKNGKKKDTVVNIETTGDFVINVVTEDLVESMNVTSKEYTEDVDEFKEAHLNPMRSDFVKAPRLAQSPVNLECRLLQNLEFGEFPTLTNFIIGEVIQVHVLDKFWGHDSLIPEKLKIIGRLGQENFCRMSDIFEIKRPM